MSRDAARSCPDAVWNSGLPSVGGLHSSYWRSRGMLPGLTSMTDCPNENELLAYFGQPRREGTEPIEDHLAGCGDCRALVAAFSSELPFDESRPPPHDDTVDEAAHPRHRQFGRYLVTSTLGRGAMSIVHGAYDPELDRKVAIKVWRSSEARNPYIQRRMLREARALAQIRHRNVVGVHDVGTLDGEVWVALEFIHGPSVDGWLSQPRRVLEVLEVMLQAANGLAAVHAAGLLHRDFKPANLMLEPQEHGSPRVKLMDFGLVRPLSEAAVHRALDDRAQYASSDGAGTPAYMAPEQLDGQPATLKTDQFSFWVTMWEALYRTRPFPAGDVETLRTLMRSSSPHAPAGPRIPRWLRRACERGLSLDPSDRFASMADVVAALQHGKGRRRRAIWQLTAAGLGLVVSTGVGLHRYERRQRLAACEEQGEALVPQGATDRIAAITTHLTERWGRDGTAPSVLEDLAGYPNALRDAATRVCTAHVLDETLHADEAAKATWCLETLSVDLEANLAMLESNSALTASRALEAASSPPAPHSCLDPKFLAMTPRPPSDPERFLTLRTELARLRSAFAVGRYDVGDDVIALKEDAERLGWEPLTATILVTAANFAGASEHPDEAVQLATEAHGRAAKHGAWDIAAVAALRLTDQVGLDQQRFAEGRVWAHQAEVAIAMVAGDRQHRLTAELHLTRGLLEKTAGNVDTARVEMAAALEIFESTLGPEHPAIARTLYALGRLESQEGRYNEATATLRRSMAIAERTLGPQHPNVAAVCDALASGLARSGDLDAALPLHERALSTKRRTLGPEHPGLASNLVNLAGLYLDRGDYREAIAVGEQAL